MSNRFGRPAAVAIVTLIALAAPAPATVLAADEPNGAASCMGLEMSSISPPGSSDEEPGGAPQFIREVKELAAGEGVPAGAFISFIAQLHSGSHEACDEALGGATESATTAANVRAAFSVKPTAAAIRRGPRAE